MCDGVSIGVSGDVVDVVCGIDNIVGCGGDGVMSVVGIVDVV